MNPEQQNTFLELFALATGTALQPPPNVALTAQRENAAHVAWLQQIYSTCAGAIHAGSQPRSEYGGIGPQFSS